MNDELDHPSAADMAAFENLAVARALHHAPGCACRYCRDARAVWDGRLDEAQAELDKLTDAQLEHLLTRGFLPKPDVVRDRRAPRWACAVERCGGTGEKTCDVCGAAVGLNP